MGAAPLLDVRDLSVAFAAVPAVDAVSFAVDRGEVLGLVGESGSGKTVSSLALLRLVPPPARITGGEIRFDGKDLRTSSRREMAALRGKRMAMVFQNPAYSLNPLLSIGAQLTEILRWHERIGRAAASERAAELLRLVGIADPRARLRQFPHELSGGMKQRVCIARALLCNPDLVLADEPTTNLDVTIQAQILDLLRDLRHRFSSAMILVTHDMGVVARMADRIAVMYAGRIAETADARTIFRGARHPYTRALLESVPRADRRLDPGAPRVLKAIGGRLPDPADPPRGCRFHPRCPDAIAECRQLRPEPTEIAPGHIVACIRQGSTGRPDTA